MAGDDQWDSFHEEFGPGRVIADDSTGITTRSLILSVDDETLLEAIEMMAVGKEPPDTVEETRIVPTRLALTGPDTHLEEMEDERKRSVFGGTEEEILDMYHKK